MVKLLHKEITHNIIGLCYDVYNELGYGYQEKYYQKAFSLLLNENKIKFEKELKIPIKFRNIIIGRYYVDFLIENKIALEFKIGEDFRNQYTQQILAYLKSRNIPVGLVILFSSKGIKVKRYVN